MSFSEDLFWGDVAGDYERDARTSALTHGKVAVAAYWPFLAASYSEQDFENRLSLSLSRISSLVAPEVLDEVVSSLRDDYRLVTTAEKGGKPWEKDDDDDDKKDLKDESDKAQGQSNDETGQDDDDDDDDAKGDDEGESDSDDDDDDDSKGNQPNFLKKKQRDDSHTDKSDKAKKESSISPRADAIQEFQNAAKQTCATCGDNLNPLGPGKRHMHSENDTHQFKQSNYVPDPSNAGRYHYQDLESLPLNNGDLQGPDGFIEDLAQGEQRTPEAYARQTTPGTWSQGQGMPERPMPAGVARGYQPVAARFDKDGFLVESLVDPQLGAPLNANPYYFNDGSQGLVGDATFPTDPWGGNVPDRANQYGDVQPGVSSGSEEGQVDGNGYSRSTPGNHEASLGSPNFTRTAISGSEPYQLGWSHTIHDERNSNPYAAGSDEHQAYEHGYAGRNEDGSEKPNQSNYSGGAENYNSGYWKRQSARNRYIRTPDGPEPHPDYERALDSGECTCGWGEDPDVSGARQRDDNCPLHGHLKFSAATDGKIVGNCPGCDKPLRKHTTAHGDEYHHLHNDHVRCFGKSASGASDLAAGLVGAEIGEHLPGSQTKYLKDIDHQLIDEHHPLLAKDWAEPHPNKTSASHFYEDEADRITSRAPRHSAEPFPVGSVVHVNRYPEGRYHSVIGHSGDDTVHLAPYGHEDSGTRFPESRGGLTRIANQYIKQQGGKWVITQKGTGKVLSHHDSEEQAEASFRAMMQSKHGQVGWGHDTENHGSWSFQDALGFNANTYGTHFDKEGFVVDAADYVGRPDALNPTGRGPDEYKARTWDAYSTTRPMQSSEDRNVNTPVLPAEPIKTRNVGPESGIPDRGRTDRIEQSGGDEDEED